MVDRGVGPTPNPAPSVGFPGPFLGIPTYLPDPRANVFESPLGYAGCLFSPLPYSLNPPIMVNSTTNEGRYHWPPGATPLQGQPCGPGVGINETFSDLTSGAPLRSPYREDAAKAAALASRFHWEQYQRLAALHQHGALTMQQGMGISPNGITPFHCRISPSSFSGYQDGQLPQNPFSPHNIIAFPTASQKSAFSEHPATPGSGSITLPGSLEGSRLNSPHPSVTLKNCSRKRALSHSPLDFGLDIENLTRSSESSLLLQSFGQASRTSSNASGSYGHLSAMSLSALGSGIHMFGHPAVRHGAVPPVMLYSPILHPCFLPPYQALGAQAVTGQSLSLQDNNSSTGTAAAKPEPKNSSTGMAAHEVGCCSIVSSTVGTSNAESRRMKMKKEDVGQHAEEDLSEDNMQMQEHYDDGNESISRTLQEREPDFYETNCHWKDCSQQYETQEELVKHLNQDHIASSKKFFVCEWEHCLREKKPFKAQYMLVVHMRRHTGEKPHQCQFQGCSKAYSRLENLKTHLRSHTGEKPYLCEHPGCSKAFSNASDRAKHQNRTHSNAKPYTCKAPGCTKCYTDPSSLRKHVKTVHGLDFYANKKHKGDQNEDGYSSSRNYGGNAGGGQGGGGGGGRGGGRQQYSLTDRQSDVTENSNGGSNSSRSLDVLKVQDCLRVTPLHPANNLARKKFSRVEAVGNKTTHQHRARPEPIVGNLAVTRCQQDVGDFDCNTENLVTSTIGGQILTETEEDILSEFLQLPATTVSAVSQGRQECDDRASVVCTGPGLPPLGHFRSKLGLKGKPGNNYQAFPPLGNTSGRIPPLHGGRRGNPETGNQMTDIKARTASRKIVDNSSTLIREALQSSSRRDSNTSTLSSYLSSIRSDSSPFPQFYHSSRRPSDSSQRSYAQSPYEYDISDCHQGSSLRGSAAVNTLSSMLTSRMAKTKLGNSMASLHAGSGTDYQSRGGLVRFLMSQQDHGDRRLPPVTGGYSTPCRTPLPHEIPNHDIRRASDPVRTGLGSLRTVREFQRCHSLNTVQRSTAPKPTSHVCTTDLYSNYNSSCTSIATDFSLASEADAGNAFPEETEDDAAIGCCNMVNEALLERRMFQDSCQQDDLIIPDEMQEYLDANGLGSGGVALSPNDHFDLDHANLMGHAKETRSGQFVGESQSASIHLQQTGVPRGWNGNDMWPTCTSMEVGNQQVMDYDEGISIELEGYGANMMQNDLNTASNCQLPLHNDGQQRMSWLSGEKFSRIKTMGNQSSQPLSLGSQMQGNASRNCLVPPLSNRYSDFANRTQNHSLQPQVQVSQVSQSKMASARLLGTLRPSAQGTGVAGRRFHTNTAASNSVAANSSVTAQKQETIEKQLLEQNAFCRSNLTEHGTALENERGSHEGTGASIEMLLKEQYLSGFVLPCFPEDTLSRHNVTAEHRNGDPSQQVSSSTDAAATAGEVLCAVNDEIAQLAANSMGDCLLDSLGSISLENVMSSPSMMTNHSASSTVSRMTTPRAEDRSSSTAAQSSSSSYLKTSNMAVNDMTSLLAQLVQENKYRNMCG